MVLSKEEAKRLSIISVAEQLGMELKRTGSYSYTWTEHDSFVIDARKNEFHWNSRTEFGDVIQLVQSIKGVSYKEAMHFLETGEFKAVDVEAQTASKEPFSYYLERYERQDFSASRNYLKAQRGLSDDTINFFISQGNIAEAIRKKGDYFEPVIVFKYKDNTGFLAGASLQGIVENREHYPERGRLKQIMRNSDGQLGFSIDIGNPKRLVFAEAPIDLMSYYELHKDRLQDVRLVAMDGLKDGIISRRFVELYAEMNGKSYQVDQNVGKVLETVARTTNYFKDGQHQDMITLAVDNDVAGHNFITSLQEKGIPVQIVIPPILQRDQEKEDWNDFLKGGNNTPKELAHVYTVDEKSWHYQGFFEKEIALGKAQELTADDVKAFVSDRQLTREEVRQEYTRIVEQEKERKHTMSEVHEAGTDFITKLREKKIPVVDAKPPKREGQEKTDWNDALRTQNQQSSVDLSAVSVENEKSFNNPLELVWELHGKWRDELAEKIREDLGINYELQAWQFEKEMSRFITTDLDKLFAKRTRLERDAYFADSTTSIRKEIDRLDAQILEYIEKAPEQSQEKTDWNDALRTQNQQSLVDSSAVSVENEKSFNNPLELVWELHRKWEDELAEKIREDLGINHELQAWQFEKEMSRFITTDLDKLFAKRTRLERDAYFADSTTSIRKEIDRLDAQILEYIEKAPEKSQELDMIFEQQKNERTSGSLGSLQPEAEGSPTPVPKAGTFERSVTSRPTTSSHLLYFTINEEFQSSNDGYYHSISLDELTKLNRPIRRLALQNAAQYYLDELANSKIYYVTPDKTVQVHFEEKHFMHLTGIKPIALGQTPEKTLHDFAEGNGHFDNILLANNDAAFDKLKVLSDLSVATESTSFYFDDLTDLRRYDGRFDSLIKSDDKDIILLFKELEEENYIPISVFKSRTKLTKELEMVDKTPILGVFRERDGRIEQLSINEDYVKDRGNELQTILKDGLFEEIKLEEQAHNKQELKRDADADGVSDEEELLQGTNPYDFRSKPASKPNVEEELQAEEVVLATGSLAVADFIQNKDMAGLSRHLKEGIKEFLDSDKYKDYLTKMSHLNNYSNRNLRLILAQNPEASQVASFKQWKENFGRYVKKGEKALRIFKPMTKIKKDENNQPILDKNGKPETVTFFGLAPVFDVSQTEGKEMPKAAEVKEQLTDLDYANLYRALMAIAKENDVSVRFEEMENNKHGYYSVPENQIVLRSNDMNKAQIIKTFLHEMAHAELHHADNPQKENLTRSTAELQAESVAYVVSSYYGIDTSEYSFNYLSGWSADKETLADLEAQLDIVQQEAKSLMVRMDQALEQLRLSQEKQTKHSFEQKMEKFKNQSKQAVEEHKQELKADAQSKKEKGFSK